MCKILSSSWHYSQPGAKVQDLVGEAWLDFTLNVLPLMGDLMEWPCVFMKSWIAFKIQVYTAYMRNDPRKCQWRTWNRREKKDGGQLRADIKFVNHMLILLECLEIIVGHQPQSYSSNKEGAGAFIHQIQSVAEGSNSLTIPASSQGRGVFDVSEKPPDTEMPLLDVSSYTLKW